ncbi:MAG: insulinase family protein, partial [Deltaproteobacteria bacterium]|nr:insulinase family protein [Deltaproteobacteria bacterium]
MRTPSLLATLSALALVPALAQAAPAKAALKAPKTTTKAPGKELAKDGAKAAQLPAPVKVTAVEGITEYKLGNGLRVLLYPDASKPQMTVNITYLVGSKQESYGETGMAHLLEHLLFKGTDAHPDVPKVLNGLGARFNGSTWFDRTNYYVGFPASDANLSIALDLEADRMVNSHIWKKDLWDEKEQKGEMTVVRNEMEAGENDPSGVLTDRVASVAFDWHNYGKSTIGARSDVENVNTDHLKDFYRKFYQPDNAVLLVAGKIDEAKVLAEVNEKFGRIPRPTRVLEKLWTVEPTQDGERSVTVRRVGGTPVLVAGYHVPQTANQDASAVSLIQGILTEEPSGRLYKALVETKLATHAEGFAVSTLDPTFEMFSIELPKDGNVAEAKRIALETIEGFKAKPITNEELERAKARASKLSDLVLQRTDILAIQLSEAIAAGDWRVWFLKRDQTEKLTLAQVQAAAERYFKQSNRTLGEYVPTEKPDRSEMPAAMDLAAELKD